MTKHCTEDFEQLCSDILSNNKFNQLSHELHHGISRYEHSLRVARYTYMVGKSLHMKNLDKMTRAALLHDFYLDEQFNKENSVEKLSLHPSIAAKNAKEMFNTNEMQDNIIKSHMFPIKGEIPKYKESWLVSGMDKTAATYEMCSFKFALVVNVLLIFMFNMITLQK